MLFTVTMPKLSPTMESGVIAKWHKKVNDHVQGGDLLFEVATDKAIIEYNALDAGYLRKILICEGKEAKVNEAVALFTETKDESLEGYMIKEPVLEKKEESLVIPDKTHPIIKKETAPSIQQPIFSPEPPLDNYHFRKKGERMHGTVPASPLARKLAKEKGIDLSTIKGSGPDGRIIAKDIDLGSPDTLVTFGREEEPTVIPGSYELKPLTPMRKMIASRLQDAKTFIPHFYIKQEIRCDALHKTREELKILGIKVSFNDLIIRAVALALRAHPEVNSGFDTTNQAIVSFQSIDIAVAVSVEGGLITPIIRHADFKNLGEISSEVKFLATKAKTGKLAREEYMGGSFTISNLGMYGITEFTAIINPPQAAILAVSGIEEKPVVDGGHLSIGKVMHLTLSVDHRVIDGVLGAKFIKTIQKLLENPASLLI